MQLSQYNQYTTALKGLACFFMEIFPYIILTTLIFAQIALMRHFFVQMGKKNDILASRLDRQDVMLRNIVNSINVPTPKYTPGEANKVDDGEKDMIEFSENTPFELPKDIKFEIEGGDTAIPPGYSERAN